jgi:hypothetical protein
MDFLKKYSATELFHLAFDFTFVILGIVAAFATGVFKESQANLKTAKRAMNGLLALTMFALGFAFGEFNKGQKTPNMKFSGDEMLMMGVAVVLFIMAVTAYGAVEKGNLKVARKSIKGILAIALVGAAIGVYNKSKKTSYAVGSGFSTMSL